MGMLSVRQRETLQVPEKEDEAGRQADTQKKILQALERDRKRKNETGRQAGRHGRTNTMRYNYERKMMVIYQSIF